MKFTKACCGFAAVVRHACTRAGVFPSYLFASAVQFTTTVNCRHAASSRAVTKRKRSTAAVTAYLLSARTGAIAKSTQGGRLEAAARLHLHRHRLSRHLVVEALAEIARPWPGVNRTGTRRGARQRLNPRALHQRTERLPVHPAKRRTVAHCRQRRYHC